jgi:7-carboxy-7-deazaguanine synthase
MRISEIYCSLQGEGCLTGTPSIFVRTSGCNLRCNFCDTPFASWNPEGPVLSLDEIVGQVVSRLRDSTSGFGKPVRHVVLTGGEPLLSHEVVDLCSRFHELELHITIETAGTIFRELPCDLMSISPKFANSTPSIEQGGEFWHSKHEVRRFRPDLVRQLLERYSCQLKFVVDQPSDLTEVLSFLQTTCPNWKQRPELTQRVMLMPQGTDIAALHEKETWLRPLCTEQGFVFCPRRHIEWYGNERGT